MNNINWQWHRFDQLENEQLYRIIQLRVAVFVVEQDCPYQDCDGYDQNAWHLTGSDSDGEVQAYLRVLSAGEKYPQPAIGRIVISEQKRGTGLGRELVAQATRFVDQQFPGAGSRMSAQHHLVEFYGRLGYQPVGEQYQEDGIAHIEMFRPAPKSAQTP